MENKKEITLNTIKGVIAEEVKAAMNPVTENLENLKGEVSGVTKGMNKSEKDNGINQARVLSATIESIRKQESGAALPAGGRAEDVKNILTERYGKKDPHFVKDFDARYKDLMATGNGGELIIEEYAAGFLDQLWDATILPQLGVSFIPTSTGNLNINKIVEGVAAGYIGEGGTIDTSTIKFGRIRLSVKKLMALVPISNDLIRYAHVNAEALVRDQIIKEMAQVADKAFLYGEGGEFQPRGIANTEGIQKVDKAGAPNYNLGLKMLNMLGKKNHSIDDTQWVMGWDTYFALQTEVNASGNYVNKAELDAGRFAGRPFIVTSKVKADEGKEDLFLIKTNDITAIQGLSVSIESSRDASIQTRDGMMSAFGQDYTIVKALVEHDFGINYGHSVVLAQVELGK